MKIADAFPSRFIGATDLDKIRDKATPFVIQELKMEECRNPRKKGEVEQKLVVYFRGVKKGHRLRKEESQALIAKFGDDSSTWINQSVQLRTVSTKTGAGVRMVPYEGARTQGKPTPAQTRKEQEKGCPECGTVGAHFCQGKPENQGDKGAYMPEREMGDESEDLNIDASQTPNE